MKAFSRTKTAKIIKRMGGKLSYTPLATSIAITGGYAICNPKTELYDDGSVNDPDFVLLREDVNDTRIIGVPRPAHDDIIVYTDPDSGTISTYWVDELIGSDTHTWRVSVRQQ